MSSPAVDVVIVSYRSRELLGRCLESLRQNPVPGGMIVTVVDNASGDGTAEQVAAEHPWVTVLPQSENLGFGAATNIGIRRGSAPYVLALNPDAAIEADTLPALLEVMERDPLIGCAGPALYQEDGTFDHAARRAFPTPLSSLGHFTGLGRRVESGPLAAYRAPEVESGPVDAVNGAFMLLRREALGTVGLFDEEYWMYMEDLDLNWRLARAGWITWYEPSVRAIHTKGGTSKDEGHRSPPLEIAFHRGMGRFYRKHYAPSNPEPLNWLIYLGIALKLLLTLTWNALGRG
jgi:N-acetylglucosaminyl-diphospho-decaprenol L-rhamnosyltransferase